jgi:hypothetical protein
VIIVITYFLFASTCRLCDTYVLLYLAFLFNHVHEPLHLDWYPDVVIHSCICLSYICPEGGDTIEEPYQLVQPDWPNPPLIGSPPLIAFVVPRSIIFVFRR